jgi:hypothetical protein
MRDRHVPRLCRSCTAPMGRQQDACWSCGAEWSTPAPSRREADPVASDLLRAEHEVPVAAGSRPDEDVAYEEPAARPVVGSAGR